VVLPERRCVYCGSSWKIEEEHVQAKCRGGVSTEPACRKCNRSKGKKTLRGWLIWIQKNDSYRWKRIVSWNKGKRSQIARQVRTIRELETPKKKATPKKKTVRRVRKAPTKRNKRKRKKN